VPFITDSGPLIALARIGQTRLLEKLYGEVLVPPAVHDEMTREQDLPGASDFVQARWIRTVPVKDNAEAQRLRFWLGLGESEAIV
jgi:uncharacterized protein